MGTATRNRWWPDPGGLRHQRGRTGFLPALLRYRRPRRGARWSAREVFELVHGKGALARRGGPRGWAARRPSRTGSPNPADYLARFAAGVRRAARMGWRRSCIGARRCATGRSTGRSATSFLNDVTALVRRGGVGARPRRRSRRVAYEAEARAGRARHVSRREIDWLAVTRPSCRAIPETARGRWPIYRTYVEPWSGRVEAADRGGDRRPRRRPEALRRVLLLEERGGTTTSVTQPFQQTLAAGDGQGRRGHRILPLQPAARAQRGVGGDPGRFGNQRRRVSTPNVAATARSVGCWPSRRTTRSARPTCRARLVAPDVGVWTSGSRIWRAMRAAPSLE